MTNWSKSDQNKNFTFLRSLYIKIDFFYVKNTLSSVRFVKTKKNKGKKSSLILKNVRRNLLI